MYFHETFSYFIFSAFCVYNFAIAKSGNRYVVTSCSVYNVQKSYIFFLQKVFFFYQYLAETTTFFGRLNQKWTAV